MAITLKPGHTLETGQTHGHIDNPTTNGKTWFAAIVDSVTGRPVVKSALATTEAAAIADAERKYTRR
jgi:hypothetical protein